MKIKVLYANGPGWVDSSDLDSLISDRKILGFFRAEKLVVLDIHPTRKKQTEWNLPERRRSEVK